MNRVAMVEKRSFELGPDVIRQLLPYRRPLLLVDSVRAYHRGVDSGRPELWARRQISANEEVFAGHFPGLHMWPGIYTQEGLGQSCFLLEVLLTLQEEWERQGGDPDEVLLALRNLELGYQLNPAFRPQGSALLERLRHLDRRIGISASVEMRFMHPVFAGQCLDYHVARTHLVDAFRRFDVEASVEGRTVARGVMTGALGARVSEALPPER
jgi:3-hydroxymyristoyl/3-hydroxydecanoyl-(acyl carrier protein) dehydratase